MKTNRNFWNAVEWEKEHGIYNADIRHQFKVETKEAAREYLEMIDAGESKSEALKWIRENR